MKNEIRLLQHMYMVKSCNLLHVACKYKALRCKGERKSGQITFNPIYLVSDSSYFTCIPGRESCFECCQTWLQYSPGITSSSPYASSGV